ncbi:MAG: SpoIIIAH-like family protein [Firmicutes bacterium]|nr:SpoIIIAH-like family protein [Bacillota bacterium]
MKFSDIGQKKQEGSRREFWRRLTLNKWTMTFAVMLVMVSAYMGMEENTAPGGQEVLYVSDELPYDIQKVSGDGNVQLLPEDNAQQDAIRESSIEDTLNQDMLAEDTRPNSDYSINSDSDFFINYRMEREKVRSRQLEMLQQLIDDENTGADVRSEAQARIIAQAEAIEKELTLESILVAKYGGEAAVFIQPEKINLVLDLDTDEIADNEAEKIARLVDNYTGIGYENIIIVLKD